MDATANPFAQPPASPEPIVARLRRDLAAECTAATCSPGPDLDRLAEDCVGELWEASRVKIFVPVLALRAARDALDASPRPALDEGPQPAPTRPDEDEDGDALWLDDRDVLTPSDDGPAA